MKILIVSTNFSPELTGTGKYSGEMAEYLAKNNRVKVICAPPYYPEWKVAKGFSTWKYSCSQKNNLKICRCPIWIPKKTSGIKRIIHLFSFALSSFPVVLWQLFFRPDVVICVEPPLFNSFGGILLAKLCRAKSILHIQDFEVDAAFELGIIKSQKARKIISRVELFIMNRFDKISTISQAMLNKLGDKKIKEEKKLLFPNWVDTSFIYPLDKPSAYIQELGLQDKIVLLYSGNMGKKQGLDIVIKIAKKIQDRKDIVFVMCGNGVELENLKELGKECQNIIWLDLQPLEKLNQLLNLADIHLLPQQKGIADLVMPSKLTGMLSSGKPTIAIASESSQVGIVLETCGVVVDYDCEADFETAIRELADDREKRIELGKKAYEYACNNLKYSQIMQEFENNLKKLI